MILAQARVAVDGAHLLNVNGYSGVGGGLSSVAIAANCRQQAEVVDRVIRPMCSKTALICFLVHRAIMGLRDSSATGSQWPDQHRASWSGY